MYVMSKKNQTRQHKIAKKIQKREKIEEKLKLKTTNKPNHLRRRIRLIKYVYEYVCVSMFRVLVAKQRVRKTPI